MEKITLALRAEGFEELSREAGSLLSAAVARQVSEAVFSEMRDSLDSHVRDDVYGAPYTPKEYVRRSQHPEYGTSLRKSAQEAESIGPVDYETMEWAAGLRYEPTGEHEHKAWSELDGDELIGRIEKKDPAYTFESKKKPIPKRPFWQNFVWDQIEGGEIEKTLDRVLKELGIAEAGDKIDGVIRGDEDGKY